MVSNRLGSILEWLRLRGVRLRGEEVSVMPWERSVEVLLWFVLVIGGFGCC